MQNSSAQFKSNVTRALDEPNLKVALDRTTGLLRQRRAQVIAEFPQYEATREAAQRIKDHTLANLDHYLELFEKNAEVAGAKVHWASSAEEATKAVIAICRKHEAKSATRVKSMLGEEIGLPEALAEAGIERVETDLAEHIIQLAKDPPSHIVMPAMHKTHEEVAKLFEEHHGHALDHDDIPGLVESARQALRPKYFAADVSISGANFLIADSGSIVTVTNEGNAELTTALPKVHIVTVGIEKLVPSMEHCTVLLRLLARAAVGTEITQYTSFFNGPKRPGDADGPEEMHIVLVDHHRSEMLGNELKDMLRCIRCGACMNHCPVFGSVGGHAYGAVYPGPMGAILTPAMTSLKTAGDLPNACTLNGRCQEVCPVKIPLTDMLRSLREKQFRQRLTAKTTRRGLGLWGFVARRPALYRLGSTLAIRALSLLGRRRGTIAKLPGAASWTRHRDLPAPQGKTFMDLYRDRQWRGEP